ncbi:sugar phosphate isomerase/epimerase [Candidatus Roizmanbacteria bacterium]|nr:sugar phosphate isomerase/epimerase [Candidatus Roizmanbacteria bacterium]
MKLAISNIAWNKEENTSIRELLQRQHIPAIEIAPGIMWQDPTTVSPDEVSLVRTFWKKGGINIVAMQGLLFRQHELKLFDDTTSRKKMYDYLVKIIELAYSLGVESLIFGSPTNRIIPDSMPETNARDIAFDFFNSLGFVAQKNNVFICIEANPESYGTNFLNTSDQVLQFVKDLDHSHIRLQLDIGAMTINKEDYASTINKAVPFAHHVHVSEPDLKSIPQKTTDHESISHTLLQTSYNGYVSIEMRAKSENSNIERVKKSISFLRSTYKFEQLTMNN